MSFLKLISDALSARHDEPANARTAAKQRLSVVLVNDRAGRDTPDFMPKLRQEIIEVLRKYVPIQSEEDVKVSIANKDNTSIMEMSVSLEKPAADK